MLLIITNSVWSHLRMWKDGIWPFISSMDGMDMVPVPGPDITDRRNEKVQPENH